MIEPCYTAFLRELAWSHALKDSESERWRQAVLADQDLADAAEVDDVASARTALAKVTRAVWPDSSQIPRGVQMSLRVLRVAVRW
ncbi:MAG: hypothetical protein M9894_16100 [Planctomycetes bacterium]|nr:hypothetical protein [Planctomycetota bacterium]